MTPGSNNGSAEPCGLLLLDKPEGFTSFDLCAKMRRVMGTKRIGHTGTLDPMATGLMVVLVGRATLLSELLPETDKRYTAGFRLGITTDTLDITGSVLSEGGYSPLDPADIEAALGAFRGDISQIPPMFSAVHKDGRRLYDLARKGETVEREARPVTIRSLTLLSFDSVSGEGVLDVCCSKGTYIRSLIDDIGRALGCGGVLTSLRRTEACGFALSDAVTPDRADAALLIPPDRALPHLVRADITPAQKTRYQSGGELDLCRLKLEQGDPEEGSLVRVYCGGIIGIGIIRQGQLWPHKRLF